MIKSVLSLYYNNIFYYLVLIIIFFLLRSLSFMTDFGYYREMVFDEVKMNLSRLHGTCNFKPFLCVYNIEGRKGSDDR